MIEFSIDLAALKSPRPSRTCSDRNVDMGLARTEGRKRDRVSICV